MWLILSLLSAFFAALVAIFGKIGIKNIDTTIATTIRALVMGSFLILISLFFGKIKIINSLDSRSLKFILLSGIAGALSWLFYFAALKMGLASRVATIDRLSIIFVLILSAIFLGETITLKSTIGAVLVVIGAVLMII